MAPLVRAAAQRPGRVWEEEFQTQPPTQPPAPTSPAPQHPHHGLPRAGELPLPGSVHPLLPSLPALDMAADTESCVQTRHGHRESYS